MMWYLIPMTHPVLIEIIRGESFSIDIRLVGEDLTGSTPYVRSDAGVPYQEIDATVTAIDTISLTAVTSLSFSTGQHDLNLWVDWDSGETEVVISLIVSVVDEIGATSTDTILDGGAPDTEYSGDVDGGEA